MQESTWRGIFSRVATIKAMKKQNTLFLDILEGIMCTKFRV